MSQYKVFIYLYNVNCTELEDVDDEKEDTIFLENSRSKAVEILQTEW